MAEIRSVVNKFNKRSRFTSFDCFQASKFIKVVFICENDLDGQNVQLAYHIYFFFSQSFFFFCANPKAWENAIGYLSREPV